MPYKYLLFDADGTLFDYEKAEISALSNALSLAQIEINQMIQLTYQKINQQIWLDFERGLVDKDTLKTIRFKRLLDILSISGDPEKLSQLYLKKLGECSFLIDGSLDLCRRLNRDFRMAIVTNGLASVQYPRIYNSQLAELFSYIFVSEEVGYQKPDPSFFEFVLKTMKIENRDTVLIIGDSLSADIRGGVQAGIDTCWYNPNHLDNTIAAPTYEIDRYEDLLPIVLTEAFN